MSGFLHQKDPYDQAFNISENKENLNFDPLPPLWPFKAQKCNIYVHLNSIGICFILTLVASFTLSNLASLFVQ